MDTTAPNAQVQLPPTTWEQRKPFYKDVESLLLPGFLSHNVEIAGVQLAIRDPGPGDLFLIRHRAGVAPAESDWLLWGLATCIWMLDGVVLLGDPSAPTRMAALIRNLPDSAQRTLYSLYMQLFARTGEAMKGIMPFCYEDRSRSLWIQVGRQSPASSSMFGIPNVEKLGINMLQRMWLAYNQVEDLRIAEASAWANAKFVASAHHPKGVKQVSQREESLNESRLTRNQEEVDLYFYRMIGLVTEEGLADGRKVHRDKKSVSELQDEFQRWVSGDADFHDRVVREWKERVKQRHQEEQMLREEHWQAHRLAVQEEELELEELQSSLVAYSPEQIAVILDQRERKGSRKVYDNMNKMREHIYQEHLAKEPLPPPEGGFFPKEAMANPVRGASLNEQIQNRKSRLNLGPTE